MRRFSTFIAGAIVLGTLVFSGVGCKSKQETDTVPTDRTRTVREQRDREAVRNEKRLEAERRRQDRRSRREHTRDPRGRARRDSDDVYRDGSSYDRPTERAGTGSAIQIETHTR